MVVFNVEGRQFECVIVPARTAKVGLTYLVVSSPRSLGMRRLFFGIASAKDDNMWTSKKVYGATTEQTDGGWVINYKRDNGLLFYEHPDPLYQVVSIDGVRLR